MAFSAPNPPPEDMEVRVLAFMERAVAQTLGVVTLQVCACFPGPWCESELMRTQSYLAAIHVYCLSVLSLLHTTIAIIPSPTYRFNSGHCR